MTSRFKLEGAVGPSNGVKPRDAQRVKRALMRLGHLDSSDVASLDFVDSPTLDGLKAFQKRNGLVADGIAKPGGPTEALIADALEEQGKGTSGKSGGTESIQNRVVKATQPSRPALAQAAPKPPAQTWDKITDQRIAGLHPRVRGPAAAFVNDVEAKLGIKLRVTWAHRPIKDQNEIFKQGRTAPGNIVTKARGGDSNHNYGLAIDVVEMRKGRPNWNTNWNAIGRIGMSHGFQWGGNWKDPDRPHFEMTFGLSIQQLKQGMRPK